MIIAYKSRVRDSKKVRDSNMELLRIVAMLFVVMVHTCDYSVGTPVANDVSSEFAISFSRLTLQSITVVCVNLFVLISGWYGIKPKKGKFIELLFQLAFFILVCLVYGYVQQGNLSLTKILMTIRLHKMWWFIRSYILLFFLAPVLNAFCEKATKKEFMMVLIAFYVFSSYNWLSHFVDWMVNGYCTMSFVGLYLLARFARMYLPDMISFNQYQWLLLYAFFTTLTICLAFVAILTPYLPIDVHELWGYDSPFVVLASLSLLLFFSKLKIQSSVVNWVAKSCFAVYLLHTSHYIFPDFKAHLSQYYQTHSYWTYLLYSIVFSVAVFAIGILLDKVRILSWNLIAKKR